jgi:hypothetical protein
VNSLAGGASAITKYDIDTLVIFGASIMDLSFNTVDKAALSEGLFADAGVRLTVYDRAVAGRDTTDLLAALPAIITEFSGSASTTMFAIHWAGNDVTSGSYPLREAIIDSNCRTMCQLMKDAGFKIALSNITYRIPPNSNPSEPYNTNVMDAIISDFADVPLDLYDLTLNNQGTWFEIDGVHPAVIGQGLTREHFTDRIAPKILKRAGVVDDVLLQFGTLEVYPGGENSISSNGSVGGIVNTNLSPAGEALFVVSDTTGSNTSGRGNTDNPADTSISLTNNNGLLSAVYSTGKPIIVMTDALSLDVAATYTVKVTASRAAATRTCDVIVGGVTQVLDVTTSPASIVTFTGVSGADLSATGISSGPSATYTFGYISLIQITKE